MSFATLWVHEDPKENRHRVEIGGQVHHYAVHTVGRTPIASQSTNGIAKRPDFASLSIYQTVCAAALFAKPSPAVAPKPPVEKERRKKRQRYPQKNH